VRRRALAIREKSLGPEHPETASALNDLAILLQNQGDLVAARPLLERALTICETTLGPSMRKLRRLNDLAIIQDQGDLEEAHLLYGRALAIREKALGRRSTDRCARFRRNRPRRGGKDFRTNQSQHRRLGPRHCLRRAWPHRGREGAAGAIWAQGSMK
jgi:tetratricopeptide (TPR) repeat protein